MRSWQHAHVLIPLTATAALRAEFRQHASAPAHTATLHANEAAAWVGTSLDHLEVTRAVAEPSALLWCKTRMFQTPTPDWELRRRWESSEAPR